MLKVPTHSKMQKALHRWKGAEKELLLLQSIIEIILLIIYYTSKIPVSL